MQVKGEEVLPMESFMYLVGLTKKAPGERKKRVYTTETNKVFQNQKSLHHLASGSRSHSSHSLLCALRVDKGRVLIKERCGMGR